jgi:hypothetical protein
MNACLLNRKLWKRQYKYNFRFVPSINTQGNRYKVCEEQTGTGLKRFLLFWTATNLDTHTETVYSTGEYTFPILLYLKPEPLSFPRLRITNISRKSILLRTAAAWEENAAIFAGTDGEISRRKESTQPGIKNTNDAHVPNFVRDQTIIYVG